jgi:hypothetical protein
MPPQLGLPATDVYQCHVDRFRSEGIPHIEEPLKGARPKGKNIPGSEASPLGVLSPPDIVHLVSFWRSRYTLSLRDQMAMFLLREID